MYMTIWFVVSELHDTQEEKKRKEVWQKKDEKERQKQLLRKVFVLML